MHIGTWSADVLNKVAVSPEPVELDLVIASQAHLGLNRGARYGEICAIIEEFYFELCPEDVGLVLLQLLREDYGDQPDVKTLLIASKVILDSDDDECIFVISCDKGKVSLRPMHILPNRALSLNSQLIFVKSKRVLRSGGVSVN
ncbi:MAG: hypothetical protein ACYC4I_01660 [Minisyncoccota bacterium]